MRDVSLAMEMLTASATEIAISARYLDLYYRNLVSVPLLSCYLLLHVLHVYAWAEE